MEKIFFIAFGAAIMGGGVAYLFLFFKSKKKAQNAGQVANKIQALAESESKRIVSEAREHAKQIRDAVLKEEEQTRIRLEKTQSQATERIERREEVLEQKIEKNQELREKYDDSLQQIDKEKRKLNKTLLEQEKKLEKIAKLSASEAKKLLIEKVTKDADKELADVLHRRVELMRQNADEEGSQIVVQSIQRFASSIVSESVITVVKIESDSLKGKIIGREGRNINAFEAITGVDVIIDDSPGTITLSSFDVFRRYVAKRAMEGLLKDGRIHPSKIEEFVGKAENDAERMLLQLGQKTVQELGITGLSEPILKLLGRLRFRTSYGQNILAHSIEVAYLAEALAYDLPGAKPEICKKAGLLHDIGKAVSHEVEGGHTEIGMEILAKFGIAEEIIVAMKSHHEDFPYESIEARIIQAADAISASRPGARRETLEKYIKRLKELEAIAGGFDGVKKVFAIQAGREIRVFVNAAEVNDLESEKLSFDIARKIEKGCQYPGEVKVAVYRETKFEDVAK